MRVLIVDDNIDIIDLLSRVLRVGGHQVVIARDGASALRQELATTPDVVVCDINLPGIDGWEVCRRLKARRAVPVMLLTVRAEAVDVAHSAAVGADDHLAKPFDVVHFLSRLDRLVPRT